MLCYNCIIVEDEPLAVEVLEDYIREIPFLRLIAVCPDAITAMEVLKEAEIHLIFLDLHLPKLKGFDFLKILINPPSVIITTAYHEFALAGYEYNVLDYLLKPIEFGRFLTAVNKLKPLENKTNVNEVSVDRPYLFFNINKKMVKVHLDEILFIESIREYIRIQIHNTSYTTKLQLSQVDQMFPKKQFLRIHRSFIVAIGKIETYNATKVEIKGQVIPIGRSYKELVLKKLQKPT